MAGQCGNVLEEVTGAMYPMIGEIERFFENEGAMVSRMSGSGPTVFAVFADEKEAGRASNAFYQTRGREGKCEVIPCKFIYRIR
jgi:4-diphosphocytidyl-2-C-methyl-D-erythritol kinase